MELYNDFFQVLTYCNFPNFVLIEKYRDLWALSETNIAIFNFYKKERFQKHKKCVFSDSGSLKT